MSLLESLIKEISTVVLANLATHCGSNPVVSQMPLKRCTAID